MTSILLALFIGLSALWVFHDACQHGIGKRPNGGGLFNLGAGAWGLVTLLLWIVAFPSYLLKRRSLIAAAKDTPVHTPRRGLKTALLALGGAVLVGVSALPATPDLPLCQSQEAQQLLRQILQQEIGLLPMRLDAIRQTQWNAEQQLRLCQGQLQLDGDGIPLQWRIRWIDRDQGHFYIDLAL